MCAINGYNFPDKNLILKMKEFTSNRGPDAKGLYIDENITIYHNSNLLWSLVMIQIFLRKFKL